MRLNVAPSISLSRALVFSAPPLLLALSGCSANDAQSSLQASAGAAGEAGSGGASTAGATGANGGTSAVDSGAAIGQDAAAPLDTLESVCRAAILAQCQRRVDCGKDISLQCFGYANLCPEYYFGPGSSRTLSSMRDCIPAIQRMSCTDLALEVWPSCLVGGTREVGTGCAYGSQCASTVCTGGLDQCGTCTAVGQTGGQCVNNSCEVGAFCHQGASCESNASIIYGSEGDACDYTRTPVQGCTGDLMCVTPQGISEGVCTRLVREGEPCTGLGGLPCAAGLVCVPTANGDQACQSLRHCGATPCDDDSYCKYALSPPSSSCVPLATEGQPCVLSNDISQIPCVTGTVCTPTTRGGSNGVCLKPESARTMVCSDSSACPYPLQCVSGRCTSQDPASCGG